MSTAVKRYSVEDYLALERASEIKHEYYDGEIFAKTGLNQSHNLIVANLLGELGSGLRYSDARVYPSGMRLLTQSGLYAYPDASIVGGGPEFTDRKRETLLNPTVLIEVLSASTEAYDRGKKFDHYMTIRSLREYVLVSQDRVSINRFVRQADGSWLMTSVAELDGTLVLPSIDVSVPAAEIYAQVEFPKRQSLHGHNTGGDVR